MKYYKYDALGNIYIVVDPQENNIDLTSKLIQKICKKTYSDGILYGPLPSKKANFKLRIFNSDGSEAEKSGNGLRIFSRYLHDKKLVSSKKFAIETIGGIVKSTFTSWFRVKVEMGKIQFIQMNKKMSIDNKTFMANIVSIGNPHCVIIQDTIDAKLAKTYGPLIENNSLFPDRTNVQFMKIIDRNNIQIEIWERGVGYTLSSGTSSCAAAAVAKKLGFCDTKIDVHTKGGIIHIRISDDYTVTMSGSVKKVSEGIIESS